MKGSVWISVAVFLLATLTWVSVSLYAKEYKISGRNLYNAEQLCDTNEGLKYVELKVDGFNIACHNDASFKRKYK